jgi:small subunit ribosomal protein S4
MGFAASRKAARQLVRHGHVEVKGHKVDVPSYLVRPGEEVRLNPATRELTAVKAAQEFATRGQPVSWIQVDAEKASGKVTQRPTRDAIPLNAQEQLIVELYSK